MSQTDLNELNQVLALKAIESLEQATGWLRELVAANVENYPKVDPLPGEESASPQNIGASGGVQQ
jgi:hypothetical protein